MAKWGRGVSITTHGALKIEAEHEISDDASIMGANLYFLLSSVFSGSELILALSQEIYSPRDISLTDIKKLSNETEPCT